MLLTRFRAQRLSVLRFSKEENLKTTVAAALLFIGFAGSAYANPRSAIRFDSETMEEAARRTSDLLPPSEADGYLWTSAYRARKLPEQADLSLVPTAASRAQLENAFRQMRDLRFLYSNNQPNFPRRLSWLYPDDGCYARAAFMRQKLTSFGLPQPAKIFAFGDMRVNTSHASVGHVLWWYHVATIYRAENKVYVIDPALDPRGPMELPDWLSRLTVTSGRLEISVCEPLAYYAYSPCYQVPANEERDAAREQRMFLDREWDRMLELSRRPEQVLGNAPPW